MKKSKYIVLLFLILFFIIISIKLIFLNVLNHNKYEDKLTNKTNIYVLGNSAPRGRILDRNGLVIVDNVGVNTIYYNKIKGINKNNEIEIAKSLAKIITIEEASTRELKYYWLILNNNGNDLITEEEYQLQRERKLTSSDIYELKLSRITDTMLSSFTELDKKTAHIYSLMNKGYLYQKKEILKDIDKVEYALVMESNIPGITGEMTWERIYNYGNSLKSILGSINSIPKESSEEYLKNNYDLTDIVGISYLEYQYEEYLKGTKAKYKVNNDNTITLIEEAKRGNDLVLSIDINIQQEVEKILQDKILLAKKSKNTEYYHDSYALISDPLTGELIAASGQRYSTDGTFSDITSNVINSSFTIGSAVKGATIAVGYKNNLIEMDKYITDSCVKLYLVPQKCSHKSLGRINDLDALAQSSNYFQYLIAINLVGKTYAPNMVLNANESHFNTYRDTLKEFGLGIKTEIDLPGEQTGIVGKTIADDLLLNLAIGQYDTYTPIEVLQYINTIASGNRVAPTLMKEIRNNDSIILKQTPNILNELTLDNIYLERIRLGMSKVLSEGTGRGFVSQSLNAIGKTGTSESFYDSNNDGLTDVATITSTFTGYFPADDPKYSLVVITPNISHKNGKDDFMFYGASKITRAISDYLTSIE